jgi:cation:H+ antiporter
MDGMTTHALLNQISPLLQKMAPVTERLQSLVSGPYGAVLSLGLFLGASVLLLWRLEALQRQGLEGTALGTLVMPYCSGLPNLIFAGVMVATPKGGVVVLENCLVNNVTNMTLLLGLPALVWPLEILPGRTAGGKRRKASVAQRINRLSLLLTLAAGLFFAGSLWALGRDGQLDFGDGLVLAGIFLFWQVFHLYDIGKTNLRQKRSFTRRMGADLALILIAGFSIYVSIDTLVAWVLRQDSHPWLNLTTLGWVSGFLMVLPNALLAFYYAHTRRADVVYSSQVGDGHICIPMCLGIFALFQNVAVPASTQLGVAILLGAIGLHLVVVGFLGRLARPLGLVLVAAYGIFLYQGLLGG